MKKIIHKPYLLFSILMSMLIGGCYSELDDLEFGKLQWSPELGVPLVDSEFTLKDLLEADSDLINFTTDENNTIVISISDDSLFSQSASDYYSLNDENLDVPPLLLTQDEIDLFNANGQVTVVRDVDVDYPVQAGLREILINQGTVNLQVDEDFPATVDLSLGVNDPFGTSILDYNNEFTYEANGDPISSDQAANTFNNVRFITDDDPSFGQASLSFNIVLTRVDQDLVFGENAIDLLLDFTEMEFGALYGDLSTQDVSTEENTIETDFFNLDGVLNDLEYEFENPQFRLLFTNSMGVPVRFDVASFTTYRDGQSNNEPINDPVNMGAATEGDNVTDEQEFNDAFKSIINDVPDSVSLAIDGLIDPDDVPDNFVLDESNIKVGYEINIPLELRLSGLEFRETISLESIDPGGLQYALFKFTSENSLPIDLNFKADFLDADSTVLHTLFDGAFLAGGSTTQPETLSDIIQLGSEGQTDSSELDFLQNVDKIGIVATVATTNGGNDMVRISSDAEVKFNLAVQTKYNVNFE
ncbi:MAG: hypothetical protein ACQETL_13175 [Bacteroidota bacterium]